MVGPFLLRLNVSAAGAPTASDDSLATVRRSDAAIRNNQGKLSRLSPAEHLRRASVYTTNRAFSEAREHWQALLTFYPQDPGTPEALLGIGRSYFQERKYQEGFNFLDRVAREYPATKEGREGLNFSAGASLRMGHLDEAVDRYRQYIERYRTGERFESAHLNLIDTLREANRSKEAIQWITRTRERFAGTVTETNALFARLRLDVAEANFSHAVTAADELAGKRITRGVLTTLPEVLYLKAYSLEQSGRKDEAIAAYSAIPDSLDSYYGWLATQRLERLTAGKNQIAARQRVSHVAAQVEGGANQFPAPYRGTLVEPRIP